MMRGTAPAIAALFFLTSFAAAQKDPDALDVLAGARGALGLDQVEVRSLLASGTLTLLGNGESPPQAFRVKILGRDRIRWEVETPDGPLVTVIVGNRGWSTFRGSRTALSISRISGLGLERLPVPGLTRIIDSPDVRVLSADAAEFRGAPRHRVRLERELPPGSPAGLQGEFRRITAAELLIDPQTLLPVLLRLEEYPGDGRVGIPSEIEFRDYQDVGGLLFPSTVVRSRAGVPSDRLVFEQVEPNAEVPEGDFAER